MQQRWTTEQLHDHLDRLRHIVAPGQGHQWVHAIHGSRHSALTPVEWEIAIRIRQGCLHHTTHHTPQCQTCGKSVTNFASHALCCAHAECTAGHNRVRDVLLDCLREVDASADKEVPNLIPSAPGLRPADVLTRALSHSGETAIDVMIKATTTLNHTPNPHLAGLTAKVAKYAQHTEALKAEGITYAPWVWSAYGSPSPQVIAGLERAARKLPPNERLGTPKATVTRWRNRIAVEIWRRAARMTARCLRPLADPELISTPNRDAIVDGDLRYAPCLEEPSSPAV